MRTTSTKKYEIKTGTLQKQKRLDRLKLSYPYKKISDKAGVAIVGAGPAGLAAAIQLKRYGIDAIIVERDEPGGLLRNANLVENYPGFPNGISGQALVNLMRAHAKRLGVRIFREEAVKMDYMSKGGAFVINTDKRKFTAQFVVLASGTKPRKPEGLRIPPKLRGRVFYDVIKLGRASGRKIAIIGAGDAAFDYALNLSKNNDIIILNRTSAASCLPLLMERTKKNAAIKYVMDTSVESLSGGKKIIIHARKLGTNIKKEFVVDYAVFAIGRAPNLDFMGNSLKGRIAQLYKSGKLYPAGDVKNGRFRQCTIAIGDGIAAAMKIYTTIKSGGTTQTN